MIPPTERDARQANAPPAHIGVSPFGDPATWRATRPEVLRPAVADGLPFRLEVL